MRKGKLRQERLGVLESFGYTNSGNQNCCFFRGKCCHHTLEYTDCPSLVQTGGLGCAGGVSLGNLLILHAFLLSVQTRMA